MQEIVEMDGNYEGQHIVGALGGFLGQLIMTLAIIEKNFNRQLTAKSSKSKKSVKSSKSSKKPGDQKDDDEAKSQRSHKSGKSGKSGITEKSGKSKEKDGMSEGQKEDVDPLAEPVYKEKGWFTKNSVQNFIHYFIAEKLRTEKFSHMVSYHFEQFLGSLEKKMKLNEMRLMKEPNYSLFR